MLCEHRFADYEHRLAYDRRLEHVAVQTATSANGGPASPINTHFKGGNVKAQRLLQVMAFLLTIAGSLALDASSAQAVQTGESYACENKGCYGGTTCERHTGSNCDLECLPGACVTWNCVGGIKPC